MISMWWEDARAPGRVKGPVCLPCRPRLPSPILRQPLAPARLSAHCFEEGKPVFSHSLCLTCIPNIFSYAGEICLSPHCGTLVFCCRAWHTAWACEVAPPCVSWNPMDEEPSGCHGLRRAWVTPQPDFATFSFFTFSKALRRNTNPLMPAWRT